MAERPQQGRLRLLALPKVSRHNRIIEATYEAIEADGSVQVEGGSLMRVLFGRYDILHLHWPESLLSDRRAATAQLRVRLFLRLLRRFRKRGGRVVWTAHNPGSHEGFHPQLEALFWNRFLPLVDGIVLLSQATEDQALERWPFLRRLPRLRVPHGSYAGLYPDTVSRPEARAALEIDAAARVVLNIGLIRRYKRIDRLVDLAKDDPELTVVVAGPVNDLRYLDELRARAAGVPNFRLVAESVPSESLQIYFRAADLFAVPYDSATNSGSALLALSFDLPVLAPDLPIFRELHEAFGDGWIRIHGRHGFGPEAVRTVLSQPRPETVDWSGWDRETAARSYRPFFRQINSAPR